MKKRRSTPQVFFMPDSKLFFFLCDKPQSLVTFPPVSNDCGCRQYSESYEDIEREEDLIRMKRSHIMES